MLVFLFHYPVRTRIVMYFFITSEMD